ncbi:hypothetical protein F5Y05DRAFT_263542 [Hypoxylon sp. FL0543]|nr:hypothetical protein F5Y05DRAFT_263542 [Hypoxylon sp. FL0543]
MNVLCYIWKDLKLLNATVFAQWFAVLSSISIILLRIIWLVGLGQSRRWATTLVFLDMMYVLRRTALDSFVYSLTPPCSLMPLNTLSVEMPHVFRWPWVAIASVMWCLVRGMYTFAVNIPVTTPVGIPGWVIFLTMFRFLWAGWGIMLPFHNSFRHGANFRLGRLPSLLSGSEAENLYSVHVRAWYHLAYASMLVYGINGPMRDTPRSVKSTLFQVEYVCSSKVLCNFEPAFFFSMLASLAYWVALWAGQEHVFSRTLGGPGVERMTFIRPGRVSQNDSIGLDEGRIRL